MKKRVPVAAIFCPAKNACHIKPRCLRGWAVGRLGLKPARKLRGG